MSELKKLKGLEMKNLVENWKKEMSTRESWTSDIGLSGIFKISFWEYFKAYRVAYFMLMCNNGIATKIAWNQSNILSKEDIMSKINIYGWTL